MSRWDIAPLTSWTAFLDAATAPPSIRGGAGRDRNDGWAGAGHTEALDLAVAGWTVPLAEVDVTIGELRERAGLGAPATVLEPRWDVTGGEVDVGAYLAGVPECMVDAVPRVAVRPVRTAAFLLSAGYPHTVPHALVRNRGLALAALSAAIIDAGHGVEIWSGYAGLVGSRRCSGVARVVSAGEPLHVGRLVFAAAHPAMLRRLWFAVWDGQEPGIARAMCEAAYGRPRDSVAADLPAEVRDPYVFPRLSAEDRQWASLPAALAWCREMFTGLGLLKD